MLKRHHTEHQFHGEFFGNALAKFLNHFKETDSQRRILSILDELRELTSVGVFRRTLSDSKTRKRIDKLNERLSRYKASPVLLPSGGGFKEFPSSNSPQERAECLAVRSLIQLANLGKLDSIKLCEYKDHQWFFAKFAHQRFCPGGKCQIRWNAETPEAKAYRAKKAREYYWHEKDLKEKAERDVGIYKSKKARKTH